MSLTHKQFELESISVLGSNKIQIAGSNDESAYTDKEQMGKQSMELNFP